MSELQDMLRELISSAEDALSEAEDATDAPGDFTPYSYLSEALDSLENALRATGGKG